MFAIQICLYCIIVAVSMTKVMSPVLVSPSEFPSIQVHTFSTRSHSSSGRRECQRKSTPESILIGGPQQDAKRISFPKDIYSLRCIWNCHLLPLNGVVYIDNYQDFFYGCQHHYFFTVTIIFECNLKFISSFKHRQEREYKTYCAYLFFRQTHLGRIQIDILKSH